MINAVTNSPHSRYIVDISQMFTQYRTRLTFDDACNAMGNLDSMTEVALELALHYKNLGTRDYAVEMLTAQLDASLDAWRTTSPELPKIVMEYMSVLHAQLFPAITRQTVPEHLNYIRVLSAHIDGKRHPISGVVLPAHASLYLELAISTC